MKNKDTFELSELINKLTNLTNSYGEIINLDISCENKLTRCEIKIYLDYGGE